MAIVKFTRIDPKTALNPVKAFNFTATDSLSILAKAGAIKLFNPIIPFNEDEEDKMSLLNTPIYDSLIFGELDGINTYLDLNGTEKEFKPLTIDLAIITITQSKNIVTTAIQGKSGTVKEFISDGDYQISINGLIWVNDNIYPEVDVQKFINITKVPQAIKVYSNFINMFGIRDIVITDFPLSQQEGMRNQQPFTLNAISDEYIDLEVVE